MRKTKNYEIEVQEPGDFINIDGIGTAFDKIDQLINEEEKGKLNKESPEGTGSLSVNRKTSTEKGTNSVALGTDGTASGNSSMAEGNLSVASGDYSHAEGDGTTASGKRSHAEGNSTTAAGNGSHAEGIGSEANGNHSHAQNECTIANGIAQTVIGRYNKTDTDSAVIIGNGTDDTNRSNAIKIGWDGSVQSSGRLQSAKETKTVQLSNSASGTMELYRKGDLVMAIIAGGVLSAGTNNRVIGTIPEGWRPPRQIQMMLNGTSSYSNIFLNSAGQITCTYTSGSNMTIYSRAEYIAW